MNATEHPLTAAARRLRLLAIVAGLAWLMGLHPSLPLRLLVVAIVVDALAETRARAHRPRPRRWGAVRR